MVDVLMSLVHRLVTCTDVSHAWVGYLYVLMSRAQAGYLCVQMSLMHGLVTCMF